MARAAKVPKVTRRNVVSRGRRMGEVVYWTVDGEFWKRSKAMRASIALDVLEAIERGELIVKEAE